MGRLQTIFFLGKGGTGKSTAAALMAIALAARGQKAILASFDDAHNQADIFKSPLSHIPVSLTPCLDALQIDREREIKKYLKKTARSVKKNYTYLTAFNLDHYFDVLKYAPGMEEYALISAFKTLQNQYDRHDYLIIDMPPTALSLRFFNLPALSLVWMDQLEKLRLEIQEKKEIISRIKWGGREFERDRILTGIREIREDCLAVRDVFKDPLRSLLFVVFNSDVLAMAETRRITKQLRAWNIQIRGLICNHRTREDTDGEPKENAFPSMPVLHMPFSPSPLVGLPGLNQYAHRNHLFLDELLLLSSQEESAYK